MKYCLLKLSFYFNSTVKYTISNNQSMILDTNYFIFCNISCFNFDKCVTQLSIGYLIKKKNSHKPFPPSPAHQTPCTPQIFPVRTRQTCSANNEQHKYRFNAATDTGASQTISSPARSQIANIYAYKRTEHRIPFKRVIREVKQIM